MNSRAAGEFENSFKAAAIAQFGSGWVWLVRDGNALKIIKTLNADTPAAHGQTALLTCDGGGQVLRKRLVI